MPVLGKVVAIASMGPLCLASALVLANLGPFCHAFALVLANLPLAGGRLVGRASVVEQEWAAHVYA